MARTNEQRDWVYANLVKALRLYRHGMTVDLRDELFSDQEDQKFLKSEIQWVDGILNDHLGADPNTESGLLGESHRPGIRQ